MRRPSNGEQVPSLASSDRTARGVQIVSWLMGRPAGDTFEELQERFAWPLDQLRGVLDHLAQRRQVRRSGGRYLATPEGTWLDGAQ